MSDYPCRCTGTWHLPVCPAVNEYCGVSITTTDGVPYICNRPAAHTGQHIHNDDTTMLSWDDEGEPRVGLPADNIPERTFVDDLGRRWEWCGGQPGTWAWRITWVPDSQRSEPPPPPISIEREDPWWRRPRRWWGPSTAEVHALGPGKHEGP